MKVKIIKIVLPVFVLMLAVFSAFAFKSVEDKALLAPEKGWINVSGQLCHIKVKCENTPSAFVCTTIYQGVSHQAFGKITPEAIICDKVLYRPQ